MEFLTSLANGTAVTGKIFPNAEHRDFANKADKAGKADGSSRDAKPQAGGKAEGGGPVPMSVARVKDAQAIVSRKLKRSIDPNSPFFEQESHPRKRRRGTGNASSPASRQISHTGSGLRSPEEFDDDYYVTARIDTKGINEERLKALQLQAEHELGPSPPPSPEISWKDFEPELKPFIVPEDLLLPLPRSAEVSPDRSRGSVHESEVANAEQGRAVSISSGPPASSSSHAERSHPSDRPLVVPSPRSDMAPPPMDRGKSIMSLLN